MVRTVLEPTAIASIVVSLLLTAARADSLDGWWVSDGYGMLLHIHGDEIDAFETTTISCLPSFTAKRQAMTAEGPDVVFAVGSDQCRPGP